MKVIIKKIHSKKPRNHFAKVIVTIDDKQIIDEDGSECEFVGEVEAIVEKVSKTAWLMAKALGCEVTEEELTIS